VTLRSGGYLVINQTEALVAIDVNSGRATREHNIEDTALQTNLEAAEEVSRQLRLRDLAGLIVIDFIDMEEKRNNRAVERRLKDCLKNDRARIQVGRISHFGLMEMSRQRLRTGVLESSMVVCPHCAGTGMVRSTESQALHVLRSLEESLLKGATHNLIVRTRTAVALYILNQKRANLTDLEARFGLTIAIAADEQAGSGGHLFQIDRGEPLAAPVPPTPLTRVTPQSVAIDPEDDIVEEVEPEADEEDEAPIVEASRPERSERRDERGGERGGEGDDRGGRRRRRRRRRGRGSRDANGAPTTEAAFAGTAPEDDFPESEDGEASVNEADEAAGESMAETVAETTAERDEGASGERGGRRRRRGRRGGRRPRFEDGVEVGEAGEAETAEAAEGDTTDDVAVTPAIAEDASPVETSVVTAAEESAEVSAETGTTEPAAVVPADAAEAPAAAATEVPAEAEAPAKPKRARAPRKTKKAAEAEAAAPVTEAAAPAAKPKRTRTSKKAAATEAAATPDTVAAPVVAPEPAVEPVPGPATEPALETPAEVAAVVTAEDVAAPAAEVVEPAAEPAPRLPDVASTELPPDRPRRSGWWAKKS
jgi:ribonuclease E